MNFKKATIILIILFIGIICIFASNLFFANAQSTQHGINGYVGNSIDGTDADGSSVQFWLYYPNGSLKNPIFLPDTVGITGLSKQTNWYMQDANNFKNPFWQEGDLVVITIIKDDIHNATVNVTLNGSGNNQAPDTQLNGFCGDFFCGSNENCLTCALDCLLCGDLICNVECGENSTSCVSDCPITCGDGFCNFSMSETYITCPFDCHCGDFICQPEWNETLFTCPIDCGCGNLICEPLLNESFLTCPTDCLCGNLICDFGETNITCPSDCPPTICGNGLCEETETLLNCPIDCSGQCNNDTLCDFGENYLTCPLDCQIACGNAVCDLDETEESCPSDCPPIVCGDNFCEEEQGENYINCPIDCYKAIARCGDKKCEYAENKKNCCVDCGCDGWNKCLNNKCSGEGGCCLFGFCYSFLRTCWYWFALGIVVITASIIIYFKKEKIKLFLGYRR